MVLLQYFHASTITLHCSSLLLCRAPPTIQFHKDFFLLFLLKDSFRCCFINWQSEHEYGKETKQSTLAFPSSIFLLHLFLSSRYCFWGSSMNFFISFRFLFILFDDFEDKKNFYWCTIFFLFVDLWKEINLVATVSVYCRRLIFMIVNFRYFFIIHKL